MTQQTSSFAAISPETLQAIRHDPNEIFPGVHVLLKPFVDWEDIPPDDEAYFKYHIDPETPRAFDWERDEIKTVFQMLFPPKPYKKYRPQRRRWWTVTWIIPSKTELVIKEQANPGGWMCEADAVIPVMLETERVYTPAQPMAWSGWQYELEQCPEGFPEFAAEQGWLGSYITRSNGSPEGNEFVNLFAKICGEYADSQREWVAALRDNGVKLAHPDDGWVNRGQSIFWPQYPDFNDRPQAGDVIALGTHKKFRLVRVTELIDGPLGWGGPRYKFEAQDGE